MRAATRCEGLIREGGPRPSGARLLVLVIGLWGCVACAGEDEGAPGWSGEVTPLRSGGVLVSNPEVGTWSAGESWRLVEDVRIGSVDGGGPETFGNLRGLEVDPLGRIWVLDEHGSDIRIFGPDGTHVRTVGGAGAGPGELGSVLGITQGPQGRMWVVDVGNGRYSVFDTAGTFVQSRPRSADFMVLPWQGGFDRDGRLLDFALQVPPGGTPADARLALVRWNSALEAADTFPLPPHQDVSWEHPGGLLRATVPFTPAFRWARDSDGYLWWGTTDRFRFVQGTLQGDTIRVIEREWHPELIPAEIREQSLETVAWFTRQGGQARLADVPSERPAFSWLLPDDEGGIWVADFAYSGELWHRFHRFDGDGRYQGVIPSEVGLSSQPQPFVRDGYVYGVTRDEIGVQYVVRLRVER